MLKIKDFELINDEKVDRALNGILLSDSSRKGGVGNGAVLVEGVWQRNGVDLIPEEVEALETALIAEYDKFGGLIRRGSDKVETGSFWNFTAKKAWATPKVTFVYRFGNKVVKVPDGVELPGEIKAQKILKEMAKEEKKPKKIKKVKPEEE